MVKASGTSVLEPRSKPNPDLVARPSVQTTTITCVKEFRHCFESTAVANAGLLLSETTLFEVERWDSSEIISKPRDAAFGCERSTIRLNRDQQSVTEVHNTFNRPESCKSVPVREQHFHLANGAEIARKIAEGSR